MIVRADGPRRDVKVELHAAAGPRSWPSWNATASTSSGSGGDRRCGSARRTSASSPHSPRLTGLDSPRRVWESRCINRYEKASCQCAAGLRFARAAGGLVVAAAVLGAATLASPGASERIAQGGRHISCRASPGPSPSIDPAIASAWSTSSVPRAPRLLEHSTRAAACGGVWSPRSPRTLPVVSKNGKTDTFAIRRDARFSNGAPVLARDDRPLARGHLDPVIESACAPDLIDLVGAPAILEGRATTLSPARSPRADSMLEAGGSR